MIDWKAIEDSVHQVGVELEKIETTTVSEMETFIQQADVVVKHIREIMVLAHNKLEKVESEAYFAMIKQRTSGFPAAQNIGRGTK